MINFLIVTCGYKCEDTIQRCIDSVNLQSCQNWSHRITIDSRCIAFAKWMYYDKREWREVGRSYGKMHNFYNAIELGLWGKDTADWVIVDLDADDYLEPNALEVLAEIYKDPNIWCTHGSYRMLSGRPARFNGVYSNNNFRGYKFKGTHLKSFRAPLFYKIKPKDFKGRDGKWLMTCSDLAIMWPVMEMSGLDRIRFVPEVIYNYNDLSDLNDHKVRGAEQKRVEGYLRRKPSYKRLGSL